MICPSASHNRSYRRALIRLVFEEYTQSKIVAFFNLKVMSLHSDANSTAVTISYTATPVYFSETDDNGFSNQTTLPSNISSVFVSGEKDALVPTALILVYNICIKYVSFGIWLFAFPANILILLVLMQKKHRGSSINIYFILLAAADLLVNFRTFLYWLEKNNIIAYTHDIECQLSTFYPVFAMVCSSWTLAMISIERMLGVSIPHRVRLICTKTLAKTCVVFIWVIALALGITNAWFSIYSKKSLKCEIEKSKVDIFARYITWLDFIFDMALPFVIILINSIVISCYLATRMRNSANTKSFGISISIVVLTINIGFVVTQFPYGVLFLYKQANKYDQSDERWNYLSYIQHIALVLKYLNNGLNFYFYFLTGSKFRRDTKNFFSIKRKYCISGRKNRRNRRTTRHPQSAERISQDVHRECLTHM